MRSARTKKPILHIEHCKDSSNKTNYLYITSCQCLEEDITSDTMILILMAVQCFNHECTKKKGGGRDEIDTTDFQRAIAQKPST